MINRFIYFWNHLPDHIIPYIIQLGQFQIRYYGLMYIVAFSIVYLLVIKRMKDENYKLTKVILQNFFVWIIMGVMIGARLGYVLIYNLTYYIHHPIEILLPFSLTGGFHFTGLAGMSYHGGLAGIILASVFFCKKNRVSFWYMSDLIIPAIPLGYTFGRLGNFINGELYGRVTNMPWGMYFPLDPTGRLRHPSQLYEAFFEGVFLFIILWTIRKRESLKGHFLSIYLIGYGFIRFFIEFVRQPDPQIGYVTAFLTMGQILCIAMVLCGISLILFRKSFKKQGERG